MSGAALAFLALLAPRLPQIRSGRPSLRLLGGFANMSPKQPQEVLGVGQGNAKGRRVERGVLAGTDRQPAKGCRLGRDGRPQCPLRVPALRWDSPSFLKVFLGVVFTAAVPKPIGHAREEPRSRPGTKPPGARPWKGTA